MDLFNKDVIKAEAYKCSKCGQCRSVCPVFIALKNEVYSPRGRYITLNNCYLNSVNPDKTFFKNLDICLNCNLCKRFCPSNIDSAGIFTSLKSIYGFKYSPFGFNYFYKFFLLKNFIKHLFVQKKFKVNKVKNLSSKGKNILYFQGCYNKYVNNDDRNAVLTVLSNKGYNVHDISSSCCGYPFLSDGNIKKFNNNIKNIEKQIKKDTDYIVCSCDSCYETLKNSRSKIITDKLKRFDELAGEYNEIDFSDALWFKPLVRNSELTFNVNFPDNHGLCSGGENFLYLKHPEFAGILTENTKKIIKERNEEYIITTCNITRQALEQYIKNKKILSLSEYIFMKERH